MCHDYCARRLVACLAAALLLMRSAPAREPELRLQVVRGLEFVTDHEVARERLDELARHAEAVELQLCEELDLPTVEQPIRVYLFEDRREFGRFVHEQIPSVGAADTFGRHGLFLQRQGRSYVFLLTGDDLVRSLRHEMVHVVLNHNSRNPPIWVDEGLAQCYESPDGSNFSERAAKVLRWDWLRTNEPDASDLAELTHMQQLSTRAYAGAWEHMYALLSDEDHGRPQLRRFFEALRSGETPPDLVIGKDGGHPVSSSTKSRSR